MKPFGSTSQRALLLIAAFAIVSVGCGERPSGDEGSVVPRGDPRRGDYLTKIFACQECHTLRDAKGEHLDRALLFAGGIPFDGEWGLVHTANVTALARGFPDQVLESAIRGRLAYKFQMPTDLYRTMAAEDMRDIVAFLKTLKAVERPLPKNHIVPGYIPPVPFAAVPVPERAPAPGTVERGRYLARMAICQDCHSPRAQGGITSANESNENAGYDEQHFFGGGGIAFRWQNGPWLIPPNLTPDRETGLGRRSEGDIVKAIRTGVTPDGRQLNPMMPYVVAFHDMSDQDATDIVRFLRSLPPVKSGRPRNPRYAGTEPPPDCCFVPPPDPAWPAVAVPAKRSTSK